MSLPSAASLDVGDPMPAILLPSQSGAKLSVHSPDIAGDPIVLFATRRLDAPAIEQLEILARQQDRFAAIGAKLVAMTGESMAVNAAAAGARDIRFPVLSDEPGRFLAALGIPGMLPDQPGDRAETCCLLVIDCGLRIVQRLWCSHTDAPAAAALALCERLAAPLGAAAPVVVAQAPVLLVPRVFPAEFCDRLIDHWSTAEKQEDVAGGYYAIAAGQPSDPSVRRPSLKRRADWLIPDGPIHDEIRNLLSRRIAPELRKAFEFHAENYEQLRIGCYDAERGGYFRRHRDNVGHPEIRRRRFAMSLNLNDSYEGGEVRFPEYGCQLYRPPAGAALLFSCSLLHEAMEIRSGRRFVLLTFFFGPTPTPSRTAP